MEKGRKTSKGKTLTKAEKRTETREKKEGH
jgi:hypothetical protein